MNELNKLIQRVRKLKTFLLIPHNIEAHLPKIAPYNMNESEDALTHLIFDRWIKRHGNPYYTNFYALDKKLIEAFLKEKNKPENRNKNPDTDYLNALFLDIDSTLPTNSSSLNGNLVNQNFIETKVINNKPSLNIDDVSQLLFDGPIKDLFELYPDIQNFFKNNIDDIEVINFAWEIAKTDDRESLRTLIIKEHNLYYPEQNKKASIEEKTVNNEKQVLINKKNTNLINFKKRKKDEQDNYILQIEESSIERKTKAEKIGNQKTLCGYNSSLFKFKKRKIDHAKSDTIKEIQFTKLSCSK